MELTDKPRGIDNQGYVSDKPPSFTPPPAPPTPPVEMAHANVGTNNESGASFPPPPDAAYENVEAAGVSANKKQHSYENVVIPQQVNVDIDDKNEKPKPNEGATGIISEPNGTRERRSSQVKFEVEEDPKTKRLREEKRKRNKMFCCCGICITFWLLAFLGAGIGIGYALFGYFMQPPKAMPIILVPGFGIGGSELQYKSAGGDSMCQQPAGKWKTAWLALDYLVQQDCLVKSLMLEYDNATKTTKDKMGSVRTLPMGNPDSVRFLDGGNPISKQMPRFNILSTLIDSLSTKDDYKNASKNIFGAPFDFRKAPDELSKIWFPEFKNQIEHAFKLNRTKVLLIAHSYGAVLTNKFLNDQTKDWKDEHIEAFISLSGFYAGAVQASRLLASGFIPFLHGWTVRPLLQSMPAPYFFLPYQPTWSPNDVILETPTRNYTVADYKVFLTDIGSEHGYEIRQANKAMMTVADPGVKTYCIHGNIPNSTPEKFIYKTQTAKDKCNVFDQTPDIVKGAGDVIINLRSLEMCKSWKNSEYKVFTGVGHFDITKDKSVLEYIRKVVDDLSAPLSLTTKFVRVFT